MTKPIHVLVVDDQPRARQGLRALLATMPGINGIDEAENGLEALRRVEERPPDLVLLDVRMPQLDGLDATRLIKKRLPEIKVIVLSMCGDLSRDAMAAGADAFVSKTESPERLLATLAGVTAG